ncbi:HAD family hydrolase [Hespellia stercorisuis]|uniref:Phosphoglycolate phosphatase n=1 Tax=Hespellia stercorisuis DSM 15480 TaxID=1121950 RepID=A0A1M6N2J5_9FIRM|nr:HAD family hydrolase [Hespellia stercorisuis]SHJ89876.1 phosphoglycolate phosphatase [Hespellia stercorisuis DSM 15480]
MYQNILFDLDGTLTDSGPGIVNSIMYALQRFQIPVADRNELNKFIGPPLIQSFQKFYGFTEEKANQGVSYFREYYTERGIRENSLYPGIEDALIRLKDHQKHLFVATSKPEPYARQIIEYFHLDTYFDFVGGSTMDETRTAKADVIAYVLNRAGIRDSSTVLMIGDREHDIYGARSTHIASMGVLYGYGSLEELKKAGADYIAETAADIPKIIL